MYSQSSFKRDLLENIKQLIYIDTQNHVKRISKCIQHKQNSIRYKNCKMHKLLSNEKFQ